MESNLLYFRIDAAAVPIRHKDRRIDYCAYCESCGVPTDQIDDAGIVMIETERNSNGDH